MRAIIIAIAIIFSTACQSQDMIINPYRYAGGGGGGGSAPTLISWTETAFNSSTTPKTTASISVNNGDILVAVGACAHSTGSFTLGVSGGSLTWTLQQSIGVSDYCQAAIWTATASSTTSFTVSFTNSITQWFGGGVFVFRSSNGIGASTKTNTSGGPSLALTTSYNNSAVVVVTDDWNAVDGASRTWRTVNSITPTSGNGGEKTYFRDASQYSLYIGYYSDVGTAGLKTVGLSAPIGQKYSIIACEIRGQ